VIASADLHRTRTSCPGFCPERERGCCLPTTHGADRASDTPVASPSSRPVVAPSRAVGCGRKPPRSRRRHPVKDDTWNDLGCLPSVRTLRRIRWPLRPRSRDRRTAFATRRPLDGAITPPWVYAGPAPLFFDAWPTCDRIFTRDRSRRFRRIPPRARSPFTLAATLLGALRASLFRTRRRLPTSATTTTYGH